MLGRHGISIASLLRSGRPAGACSARGNHHAHGAGAGLPREALAEIDAALPIVGAARCACALSTRFNMAGSKNERAGLAAVHAGIDCGTAGGAAGRNLSAAGLSPWCGSTAPADATDHLVALARVYLTAPDPSGRELDMLMATGEQVLRPSWPWPASPPWAPGGLWIKPQAGIFTDAMHRKAKIMRIQPAHPRRHLRKWRDRYCCRLAGASAAGRYRHAGARRPRHHGRRPAAALRAGRCQIFTDVDGIYSGLTRARAGRATE